MLLCRMQNSQLCFALEIHKGRCELLKAQNAKSLDSHAWVSNAPRTDGTRNKLGILLNYWLMWLGIISIYWWTEPKWLFTETSITVLFSYYISSFWKCSCDLYFQESWKCNFFVLWFVKCKTVSWPCDNNLPCTPSPLFGNKPVWYILKLCISPVQSPSEKSSNWGCVLKLLCFCLIIFLTSFIIIIIVLFALDSLP